MTTAIAVATIVVSLIVGTSSAFFAYLKNRKNSKGTVDTSQAETLWQVSQEMLKEQRADIASLKIELAAARAAQILISAEAEAARLKILDLMDQIEVLESKLKGVSNRGNQRG